MPRNNRTLAIHTATCQETTVHQRYKPLNAKKQPYTSETYLYMPRNNRTSARHTATCQETTVQQRYFPLHAKKQPYTSETYRYMPRDNHTPAIHTATCQETTIHQRYIPLHAKKQKLQHECEHGLLIYIKDNINSYHRHDLELESLESLWLELKLSNSKPLLLCYTYRPLSSKVVWLDLF